MIYLVAEVEAVGPAQVITGDDFPIGKVYWLYAEIVKENKSNISKVFLYLSVLIISNS